MAWVTATSGTCVSIFKPMYFGIPAPDMGPVPQETYTDGSLWWKHENLHRRAMGDFHSLSAEIRQSFESLENGWFAEGRKLIAAPARQKREFTAECWRKAGEATDRWIADLERRNVSFAHAASATCGTASIAPPPCRSCSEPAVADRKSKGPRLVNRGP